MKFSDMEPKDRLHMAENLGVSEDDLSDVLVFRASESCYRRHHYGILEDIGRMDPKEDEPPNERKKRMMAAGEACEAQMVAWLRGKGYEMSRTLMAQRLVNSRIYTIDGHRCAMVGHPDGFYRHRAAGSDELWRALEMKTTKEIYYRKAVAEMEAGEDVSGVMTGYLNQARRYIAMTMAGAGGVGHFDPFRMRLILMNRNDNDLRSMEFDLFPAQEDMSVDDFDKWIERELLSIVQSRPDRPDWYFADGPFCSGCRFYDLCYRVDGDESASENPELYRKIAEQYREGDRMIERGEALKKDAGAQGKSIMHELGITKLKLTDTFGFSLQSRRHNRRVNSDQLKKDGIYEQYSKRKSGTYEVVMPHDKAK